MKRSIAQYHLPGLFEFYELYKVFLPLFREHREYFYDWCDIGSVYGAPADCIWGGGRAGFGDDDARKVLDLMKEYGISARLTFSNSLLREEHLLDKKCNALCKLFEEAGDTQSESVSNSNMQDKSIKDIQENNVQPKAIQNGVIVHADLLLDYLKKNYPNLYFVSSTTKVLTDFQQFSNEVKRKEFRYVVPDFRLNKSFDRLNTLTQIEKDKVEFLCNECCWFGCKDRKRCYETVSRKNLGEDFRISKLKDGDLAVHWCWNFCFIIWSRRNIRYISEKQYILIICWICFRFRAFYSFRMEIKPGIWYNLNIKSRFKEVKIYVVSSGCWCNYFCNSKFDVGI